MRDIRIICTGKLKEKFYQEACGEYVRRLSSRCSLTVTELPEERLPRNPSPAQIAAALEREGNAVLGKIPPSSRVIALCIEGKLCSSEELADLMEDWDRSPEKHLVFLIGSSWGLSGSVKRRADLCLSMSPMTFPHHLARVMLLEQIYRSFQIREGSPYHK